MGMFLRRGEAQRVTLKITFSRNYGSVTVNGTAYTSSTTLSVLRGASVTLRSTWKAATGASTWRNNCTITVDGVEVANGNQNGIGDKDSGYVLYTMRATADMTLVASGSQSSGVTSYNGTWTVTTS